MTDKPARDDWNETPPYDAGWDCFRSGVPRCYPVEVAPEHCSNVAEWQEGWDVAARHYNGKTMERPWLPEENARDIEAALKAPATAQER